MVYCMGMPGKIGKIKNGVIIEHGRLSMYNRRIRGILIFRKADWRLLNCARYNIRKPPKRSSKPCRTRFWRDLYILGRKKAIFRTVSEKTCIHIIGLILRSECEVLRSQYKFYFECNNTINYENDSYIITYNSI